jgi:formiminoglutamase
VDLSVYFQPLDKEIFDRYSQTKNLFGSVVSKFLDEEKFPDLSEIKIAIFGVPEDRNSIGNRGCREAPDKIRERFYKLKSVAHSYKIADLGNLRIGATVNDTYAAVSGIMVELMREGILPVILGGSQDLTFAQYVAYQKLEETVNIVSIDAYFDLGTTEENLRSHSYLGKIILHEPNFLFNFSNIGYQTYFAGADQIELMNKLYFDAYRLGDVRKNIEETEPIVRSADILSFDVSSIRQSDAPGNANATPNGFYGEEACAIMRYAGLSDKLTSIGLYEVNPSYDQRDQTSHLVAQMLWYFIDGYYQRKKDLPLLNKNAFVKYHVNIKKDEQEIIFYKSKKSERWWMEVPYPHSKVKYHRHHLVPCSYKDYEVAMKDEMPDRWWQALQKLS